MSRWPLAAPSIHRHPSPPLVPCSRVWEFNDDGGIPYVPFLRAPYYVWVGRVPKLDTLAVENKASEGVAG